MPLEIVRQDITNMTVDAIVNAANSTLLGGGGVDGAIHKAAGKALLEECKTIGGCSVGEAKITGAYNLPCKYVIHTVGPVWQGGNFNEKTLLSRCYKNSLDLAKKRDLESIAFPLISTGSYCYPKEEALKVAVEVITDFLLENDMYVYIVVFDKSSFRISANLFSDIQEYIDDNYVNSNTNFRSITLSDSGESHILYQSICSYDAKKMGDTTLLSDEGLPMMVPRQLASEPRVPVCASSDNSDLNKILENLDESFSEMLLRKIDESGMTDAQCYKKANIDRKLFSKIRSDKNYKPSKPTVLAFAIALSLPLSETNELLNKAGFALSHSYISDIIIEYFIKNGIYDIFQINEALFAFDQGTLGG